MLIRTRTLIHWRILAHPLYVGTALARGFNIPMHGIPGILLFGYIAGAAKNGRTLIDDWQKLGVSAL